MKVLFIGGTGVISSACSQLCIEKGFELYLLNRGKSFRANPVGAKILTGDIRNPDKIKPVLDKQFFDVVVDWIAYEPHHIENDFELFKDKTSQFIFISSASVYQKPASKLPIKEIERLYNPYWSYARGKINCENKLLEFFQTQNFPFTIVRPSHTYDAIKVPLYTGYTPLHRMLTGKQVILHGDGTSLWTLTHNKDFAKGFVPLLGNSKAIGEAFHITSDEVLSWNEIYTTLGEALNVEPKIIHIPSEFIRKFDNGWGDGLFGDKAHNMIFDNEKIRTIANDFKAVIQFKQGAKEIAAWFLGDESRREVNYALDKKMDEIIVEYEKVK